MKLSFNFSLTNNFDIDGTKIESNANEYIFVWKNLWLNIKIS